MSAETRGNFWREIINKDIFFSSSSNSWHLNQMISTFYFKKFFFFFKNQNFKITPFIQLSNDASPKHPSTVVSRSVVKTAHFRSSPGGITLSKLHLECDKPHYEEAKKQQQQWSAEQTDRWTNRRRADWLIGRWRSDGNKRLKRGKVNNTNPRIPSETRAALVWTSAPRWRRH